MFTAITTLWLCDCVVSRFFIGNWLMLQFLSEDHLYLVILECNQVSLITLGKILAVDKLFPYCIQEVK